MTETPVQPVETAHDAALVLSHLEDAAWALAGFQHLVRSGALTADGVAVRTPEDEAASQMLAAVGLVDASGHMAAGLRDLLSDGSLESLVHGIASTIGQISTAIARAGTHDQQRWAAHDDATLLAQGKSSALGGRMLAAFVVPSLDGLSERFAAGGTFLDVGVGVAELAVAFCQALPNSRAVGLDVLPRALELGRDTIATHALADRIELRRLPVQELADQDVFDLAWMPAPFLPQGVFEEGLRRVGRALRPGGWLIVAAGRFDGDALAVAVTRWKTVTSGGTPLTSDDARRTLEGAGLVDIRVLPTPPGAPALYAGRRPEAAV